MPPRNVPTFDVIADKERLRAAYDIFNTADGQIVLAHLQFLVGTNPLPIVMQQNMYALSWHAAQKKLVEDIESYVSGIFDPSDLETEYATTGGEFDG